LHHVVHAAQHFPRRYADDPVAKAGHVLVPPQVAFNLAILSVIRAIDLDHQLRRAAAEVGDVRADWVLPTECRTCAPQSAQTVPE
jgi:hypothetical protein